MLLRMYSIFDKPLGVYLAPFVARADVEAIRQLQATLSDPRMATQPIVTNSFDYHLVFLATLDDITGRLVQEAELKTLACLASLVPSPAAGAAVPTYAPADLVV